MISGTDGQDEIIKVEKKTLNLKMVFWSFILLLGIYFCLPILGQWHSATPRVDMEKLSVAPVFRGDLIRDVAVSGKIVAANAPQLYSTEQGQVSLTAKPGQQVSEGQVVAVITSPELDAQIKQQKSALEQLKIDSRRGELQDKEAQLDLEKSMNAAQSALNVAKRENQRAELSFKKQVMSEVDLLRSRDELSDAELQLQHARKRVQLSKERLEFESQNREFLVQKEQLILDELKRRQQALEIKAPISGVVGNWLVAQQNSVAANTPVMSIVDLSEYEAELYVPEFYADDLGIGLSVSMKVSGVQLAAEVISISPEIKDNQVQVKARIVSENNVKLRQNQRLNARIEFEKKSNVLMVKRGAFLTSTNNQAAYKLSENQTAEKIQITTGANSVEYVELLSGATAGEQLIISDYDDFNSADIVTLAN